MNVAQSLERAARRIEKCIYLRTVVTINATFKSFCDDGGLNGPTVQGEACPVPDLTLGKANPTAWHVFTEDSALRNGLDPKYMYPSALAKQYVPDDLGLVGVSVDISSSFNSDVNWWFPGSSSGVGVFDWFWGSLVSIAGGFNGQALTSSYDLEQSN